MTRAARAWVVIVLVLTACALLGACASGAAERPSASGSLVSAITLAHGDARLVRALDARAAGEGFERDGTSWTSPGWRSVKEKKWDELGARLPARADAALEVGVSQFPATRMRLIPRDAERALGELVGGRVVYPGAYGRSVDLVVTTTRTSVEQLFVLRERAPSASFTWDVELPKGVAGAENGADGGIAFLDPKGERVLTIPPAYALDALGERRAATLAWDARARTLGVELDARGLTFPVLLDPAIETAVWTRTGNGVTFPDPRSSGAMVYDAARGRVVLFGGFVKGSVLGNDTWTWDGVRWTQAIVASPPSARRGHAMAYDAARGKVVLFGGMGTDQAAPFNDTWTWDGVSWTQAVVASPPPARQGHAMAYDTARGKIVLFGGGTSGQLIANLNDTWTWDGASWTQAIVASPPSARRGHAMVYDAARAKVVLFGGGGTSLITNFNDTWTWDGSAWTALAVASPPSTRYGHAMAYDAARGTVVLLGGIVESWLRPGVFIGNVPVSDMWTWDGAAWTLVAVGPPRPLVAAELLAYDAARGKVVFFGGDTWTWDGAAWSAPLDMSPPSDRSQQAMTYDTARSRVVLFGGSGGSGITNDTWAWDGVGWNQATVANPPPVRYGAAMAYDAARGKVVLFGGNPSGLNSACCLNDTWTWDGVSWTQAAVASPPPGRYGHAMAYDKARGKVVLFGGFAAGGASSPLNDTWTWDGAAWTQAAVASSPSARAHLAMAYDDAHGKIALFGGEIAWTLGANDTWTWDGAAWTHVVVASSPSPRYGHAMAYDTARNKIVLFGGAGNLVTSDTWTWDGGGWTQEAAPSSPSPRYLHGMAYDAARSRIVLFGGGVNGTLNDTWLYYARGGTCATAADCGTGSCVDGVCCETAGCGTCQACNLATPGICSAVTSAPDPDTCSGTQACDAAGVCKPALGAACTTASQCASGFCVDGACCDVASCGFCQACAAKLKVAGASGTCGLAIAGSDPRSDCPDEGAATCQHDGQCDGKGGCRVYASATACGATACTLNRLTGLVCDGFGGCITDSIGTDCGLYACNPVTGGGCPAACTADAQCVLGAYCHAGKCMPRNGYGAACTDAAACPQGAVCVDGVCCSTPCTGQCEACDVPGVEGTCAPVVGLPHAKRPACSTGGDTCTAATCDGLERTSCGAFVGSSVSCRAASCDVGSGVATLPAACDGRGGCPAAVTKVCAPFACENAACKDRCATDADCAPGNLCDPPSGRCISGTTCDGDHTITGPTGDRTNCAPYRCDAAGCLQLCHGVQDCVFPAACDNGGHCVAPSDASGAQAGCAVSTLPGEPRWGWLLAFVLGAGLARRRVTRDSPGEP